MKKRQASSILAAFALCAASLWGADLLVRPGAFVAADMGDGYWCRGTAVRVSAGKAEFVATDGRRITLSAASLIPFSKNADVSAGDAVLAIADGDSILYSARVKARDGSFALIAWDDGGADERVRLDRLVRKADAGKARFPRAGEPAAASDSGAFWDGTAAAGMLSEDRWYYGIIDGADDGQFLFVTEQGRRGTLPRSKLRLLSDDPKLSVGQAVAAVWGREDKFSAGTVAALRRGGAVIEWADGMRPSFVENRRILIGVDSFKLERDTSASDKRLTLRTASAEFQIAPSSGKIYSGAVLVGEFDASSGAASTVRAGLGWARISVDGSIIVRKKAAASGRLERSGALFRGENPVGAVGRDGFVYRGSAKWSTLDEKKPTWDELRMIAAVLTLFTDDFGF